MKQNKRKVKFDKWDCVFELDKNKFDPDTMLVASSDDETLYKLQITYATIVIPEIFQTPKGKDYNG